MILKEVLNKELGLILEGEHEDNKEIHTSEKSFKMMDFVVSSRKKDMLEVLETIQKSCELESFWKASSEEDRNLIKDALEREMGELKDDQDKSKCQGWLKEIEEIEKKIESEKDQSKVKKINTANTGTNYSSVESKPIKTIRTPSKKMVFGCSIAVGLVVGLGFFAAGIPLGYASMAGFMAGIGIFAVIASAIAITSTVCCLLEESKPSKDLNKVDAAQHAAAGADLQHN